MKCDGESATCSNVEEDEPVEVKLSDKQRAQIERNRQKALLIRQARSQSQPNTNEKQGLTLKRPRQEIDTGAGFFIEEDEEVLSKVATKVKHPLGPVMAVDNLICSDCQKEFMESFLYEHFDLAVCDVCREKEEKYKLITKTDAKSKYLLKDCDFDKREPPLKFIIRKNRQNPRWGDMKLYLSMQAEARALEVWGSEENIEEQHEQRVENREKTKQKKFDKRVKELRMAVRSSLWRKTTTNHEHEYGEESYNEDEDEYSKTCKTCAYVMTYEKM
ncbi:DNA repair protein complementing XP-A cells homolog [Gigantopelta aegis]|uniref:DNA repair protein complementing XP-A cells homolog n=1 Tax=Gigantopelta aegis TaxID=1735272 RepID=UPI001B889DD4|nr:DNA repair protein complementing XP-A cells homolog [Gigantopelta aegis]